MPIENNFIICKLFKTLKNVQSVFNLVSNFAGRLDFHAPPDIVFPAWLASPVIWLSRVLCTAGGWCGCRLVREMARVLHC